MAVVFNIIRSMEFGQFEYDIIGAVFYKSITTAE